MIEKFRNINLKKYSFAFIKGVIVEALCVSVIIYFLRVVLDIIGDSPYGINRHEIIRMYWMSAPVIFIYLVLRLINFRVLFSLYVIALVSVIVSFISMTKISLTDEPLSFNDIVAGSNISLASKYLSANNIMLCVGAILAGLLLFFLDKKLKIHKSNKLVVILFLVLTTPMAFSPYSNAIDSLPGWVKENAYRLTNKYDISYFSWDWPGNVKRHGLPMHLIQTSIRRSVPDLTQDEIKEYLSLRATYAKSEPGKKTVIFVLCESCWYDNNNFKELYQPLMDNGFTAMRATSPHYGAGTANIEFEMLTGLPSTSQHLSGIIYQEYVDIFKDNAESFAGALKRKNYYAFAAHNNNRAFWRRGDVYRKFGFDEFVDITQMGDVPAEIAKNKKPWQWQTDDIVLYRAALKALREKQGRPIFMNLITMGTHGPFPYLNDSGETVYKYEVAESISRLTDFAQQVQAIDKDAVIIVYGDHKPALNKYFYEHNVLPHNLFSTTGSKDEDFTFKVNATPLDFGDVPVFVKSSDQDAVAKFVQDANKKPYFCVASLADKYFINSGMFSVNYTQQHGCQDPLYSDYSGYVNLINSVPSWVYSVSLFENVTE
ncbi:LTA synthase family protein [Kosakonia radicincitans]|uniref:LTA synthase family protein n=1 Tax=Kosakonia radicincitans TaxID=283686 RepID=UPI0005C2C91A|nr:alkaline phosphatase family protein [Kosakonia radicincitans]KIS42774.1 sulfatase family protein [Kosakonia radicincitans YD4]